jgi:hypothetical protein
MSQKHKRPAPKNKRRASDQWRWIAAIAAVISLGGILLWLLNRNSSTADYVPAVSGAPSLSVLQESVDYGNVKLNTPIETVFRVRNVGDQALTFLREPNVEILQGC